MPCRQTTRRSRPRRGSAIDAAPLRAIRPARSSLTRSRDHTGGESAAGVVGLALVLVALSFAHGGYFADTWGWTTACLGCLAAASLAFRKNLDLGRTELFLLAALGGFALLTALGAFWSENPAASLREAQRAALYVAGATALLVATPRHGQRAVTLALASVLTGVVGFAVVRGLTYGQSGGASSPLVGSLGYANALGILAALAILLVVGIATHERGWIQTVTFAALVLLSVGLLLTASRGAWFALALGLAVEAALDSRRSRLLSTIAVAAIPAAVAAWIAAGWSESHDARPELAAATLGIALLAGICGPALAAALDRPRARAVGFAALAASLCAAAALIVAGASNPLGGDRPSYWRVALQEYRSHPVLGSGPGTFARYWRADRPIPVGAQDAHSLYLETLAEGGPFSLLVLLAALGAPLFACVRARRLRFVPAAGAAYAAFVIHLGIDWDWEMPVVTLAGLFCGGAVLVAARSRSSSARVSSCIPPAFGPRRPPSMRQLPEHVQFQ
jgi:O-antigen ligase